MDHTTVARRVRELETALGTVLFDKSRAGGFVLTAEGQRLLAHADAVETLGAEKRACGLDDALTMFGGFFAAHSHQVPHSATTATAHHPCCIINVTLGMRMALLLDNLYDDRHQ